MVAWSSTLYQQPDKSPLHSLAFSLKVFQLVVANVQFVLYVVKGQCGKWVYVCVSDEMDDTTSD